MKRIVVIGAGGHGRAVAEAVMLARGYHLVGFLDDVAQFDVWQLPVLGTTAQLEAYRKHAEAIVVAIGNNLVRQSLLEMARSAEFDLPTIIHPRAFVSPSATIGHGCSIMAGAIVGTEAQLGLGVIVNAGAIVDHHCRVEDFGHVGVGASMAGGSILGKRAWMQAGSSLGYGTCVSSDAVLNPGEGRVQK